MINKTNYKLTAENLETLLVTGIENALWYEASNDSARRFCNRHNIDLTEFLAVVAITSPRVVVKRNAFLAMQFFLDNSTDTMMQQRVNAIAKYRKTGQLSGPKVIQFNRSLLLQSSVTIDIWMSRVFMGTDDKGSLMKTTKHWTERRECSQRIVRKMGNRHGLKDYQCQAAIWCGYKKLIEGERDFRFAPMEFNR